MRRKRVFVLCGLIVLLGLFGLYSYISSQYVVPILMYHHVDENGDISSLSVSPENFLRQMRFLSERNYNPISLSELVRAKRSGQKLGRNTVVITFDDGYADNYLSAYPVLKKYNLPATIFVIVDALNLSGYLNDAQISRMSSEGIIEIGSHSLSGAYLPGRDTEELQREIKLSKEELEDRVNRPVELFCYPIGGFTDEIQELVKISGYLSACTTNRGRQATHLNNDLFALKRIKVTDSQANLFVFWVKLSGYYNFFRSIRDPG